MKGNTWLKLRLPPICERVLGFSIPDLQQVLIISYQGMHILKFDYEVTVTTDEMYREYDLYDSQAGLAHYKGTTYPILGLHGGNPITESSKGEKLILDTKSERLSIVRNQQLDFEMKYENFSGDWAVATFSTDDNYVVLGCPYDFDFVLLKREQTI